MIEDRTIKTRTGILFIATTFIWLIVLLKLFVIQVIKAEHYQKICSKQSTDKVTLKPRRGNIFDRNGNPLTMNILSYSVYAHPYLIKDKRETARILSRITGKSEKYYFSLINNNKTFVWLEKNLKIDEIKSSTIDNLNIQGIVVEKKYRRYYPYGEIFAQLIGFANFDNEGICGIELEYNPYLKGVPGWKICYKDGKGNLLERPDIPRKNPVDGNNIFLTIDKDFQTILHEELLNVYKNTKADKAMGIVMNPTTGEILAIASVPSFDPNKPGDYPIDNQKISAITDIFEPGSTLKIVTATAAFEERMVEPDDSIYCENGKMRVGDITIHDAEPYGTLSFSQVIEKSSNIGTIKIAQKLGKEKLYEYILRFGFGLKTGIKLPGEENGIVHHLKKWNLITLAQASIGHGICCTAIQLANSYCAIANGGYLLKPIIIKKIESPEGIPIQRSKTELIRQVAKKQNIEKIRRLLRLTVEEGTGIKANIEGINIAGKTGTAQKVINGKYSKNDYVATFVGFFPVEKPKYLCVVVVDNPRGRHHTGGYVSAPVVREVFKRIINITDDTSIYADNKALYEKQSVTENHSLPVTKTSKARKNSVAISTYSYITRMPDLKGKTLREALNLTSGLGLNIEIHGYGIVYYQSIRPGLTVTPGEKCVIKLRQYN